VLWAIEVIDRQVAHMARLLEDLMDVSRINRNRLELRKERVLLGDVISAALETSEPAIHAKGHDLSIHLPAEAIELDADATRLAQVLSNLLNNAAKYTEPGGRISLSARRDADHVVIGVKDSGIGIEPDHLPSLFEMFSQAAPALNRADGGMGIGLALVRGLVEAHGGQVEARSDGLGTGSELIVRLPLPVQGPVDSSARAIPALDGTPPNPLRILIAEDNRDAADTLEMLLVMAGHQVRTVYSGSDALEATESFRPQVALLDIGLPGLNGYQLAGRIRGEPWGRDILLVAITGWGQEADKRRAVEAGFDHHITKPVEVSVLERLLVAWSEIAGRR